MTDDERTEPGRRARSRQPGPPPPWPAEGSPGLPENGYGGTVPRPYAPPYGPQGTPPNRPQAALPPGRHAGQAGAPDRPAGTYQGSRRSAPPNGSPGGYAPPNGSPGGYAPPNGTPGGYPRPNGTPSGYAPPNGTSGGYPGGRNAIQPGGTPARPQGRTDPLTDPSYGRRRDRAPGYRGGAGNAPGPYGGEGPGQGGNAYPGADPNAYPGADPGRRGDRYPRDGQYQPGNGYPGDRPRDAGYQGGHSYQRDDGYPPDDRYQDDRGYQPDSRSGDRYAEPADRYAASDDRYAGPGTYRGRRRNNAPAPDDYAGFAEGGADPAEGRADRAEGARRGRRGAPGAQDPRGGRARAQGPRGGYDGDDEDAQFVPGLGGPRHRDDEEPYGDDGYDDGDNGGDGPGGRSGGGPRRRRSRWIAPLIAVVVILTPVVIGGVYAFNLYMSKYHPPDYATAGTGQTIVQVQTGQTAAAVGARLVTLGVVASTRAFELAAEHSTNSRGLEPGFYRVHKQMKASLAFALLLNPASRIQDKITIPEGWRLSQTETALGAGSGIPAADYQQALRNPGALGLPSYANGNPEGYLFPATYLVEPNMSATTVLQAMVNRFNQEATAINLPAAAQAAHMNPGQVIIIASLLQAEGGSISDYPKIARVVANRLAANMPLQFDSTVLYGLGQFGTSATFAQINSNTPYNTYKHKGLPPGPIDSPGNAAIKAALHPASGNWLYFVATKNGTKFSNTLAGLGG